MKVIAEAYDANYAVVLEEGHDGTRTLLTRRNMGGCWYDRDLYPATIQRAKDLTQGMTCAAVSINAVILGCD